jgi:inositol phosphorylceramide mannosyltransferase catalytic subunit
VNIPRRLHRLWLGGTEPEWTQHFSRSWSEHHPRWRVHEWDDDNVSTLFPLRNQDLYDAAPEIVDPGHVGQMRSDIVRYELLSRFGGVWVDTDFEALRPIDPLIAETDCFAAWETQDRWIANGLMGAIPGHPFIDRLIRELPANVKRLSGKGYRPNKLTGPQFVSRLWRLHGQGSVEVLDQSFFYPFSHSEVADFEPDTHSAERWPDCTAIHWWQNSRRRKGLAVG